MSIAPSSSEVAVGQVFQVSAVANANGSELDTIRAALAYPTDLLELQTVSLGSLYPNISPQSYYGGGSVYYGGFRLIEPTSSNGTFATLTFKALKEGTATISYQGGTRMLRAGTDYLSTYSSGQVVISGFSEQEVVFEPVQPIVPGEPAEETVSRVEVEEGEIIIFSESHPNQNQWYNNQNFSAEWTVPSDSSIFQLLVDLDGNPSEQPDDRISLTEDKVLYTDIEDGIWYFHLGLLYHDGKSSAPAHYRAMIDTMAPRNFQPILRYYPDRTDLEFEAIDQTSGIAYYTVSVDGSDPVMAESPYTLPPDFKNVAKHTIIVEAYDYAGNSTSASSYLTMIEPTIEEIVNKVSAGITDFIQGNWQSICYCFGLLVLLLLLIILFVLKRRKKEEEEKPKMKRGKSKKKSTKKKK